MKHIKKAQRSFGSEEAPWEEMGSENGEMGSIGYTQLLSYQRRIMLEMTGVMTTTPTYWKC